MRLLAAPSGRLVLIDLATGISPAYVQLPQPLGVAPTYDPARSLVYQVADHAHLYVLSLPDGRCRQVVHLGHRPDAVAVPPVLAGDFLVIAENQAKGFYLRVLRIAASKPDASKSHRPAPTLHPVEKLALPGHVTSPMAVQGTRVVVAAAEGMLYVVDLDGGKPAAPLKKIAEQSLFGEETPPPFRRAARRSFLDCRREIGRL